MKSSVCLIICFLFTVSASKAQEDTAATNNLYNRILSLDEEVRNDPSRQTTNFNPSDTASLPIGIVREIGNTKYIICIDSAYFTPDGAFFNVYMAMDFPRAESKIAFAAKGIQFNPKGVSVANGARLELVTKQVVNIGPKHQLVFKNDGKNFVDFDCNGYKQAGLSLDFVFSSDLFINANNPSLPVSASMEMVVADLSDITFQLNDITPFTVKGAEDFKFHLQNVVVDQSDLFTPSGVVLPPQIMQLYPGGIDSWRGFYAQYATITLPEKLSKQNEATEIYAQNLIIDDSGLSGSFGANNVFSTADGFMNNSWGFSLNNVQVEIANNHITGGSLAGEIEIAQLDDHSFAYTASVTENVNSNQLDYVFTISPGSEAISMNAFKSSLSLNPCSAITVQSVGNKFVPSAVLNGNWTLDFPKAKMEGIAFQNLTIETSAPFITSGVFSLIANPDSTVLFRLPISISSVGFTQTPQNNLAFTVGLGLNLGGQTVTFGANTTVRIITGREVNPQGRTHFTFDRLAVDDIAFDIDTEPFYLQGVVSVRNDDPVFGDLFFGSIALTLKDVLDAPILVSAGFGKMPDYKYWFTEASVPVNIPIVPSLSVTAIYGGVQNRVVNTQSNIQMLNRVAGDINTNPTNGAVIPFVPDAGQGLTFRAGVALQGTTEKVFNGEAMLTVAFNANGGFQSINFLGQAYLMVERQYRAATNAKKVWGDIAVNYDNANKVFDAGLNASIIVPGKLTGGLNIALHVDENDWYFWLNNPVNRANLNLVNVFYVNTYFMIGTEIMPIPPPPSYITNIVGSGALNTIDLAAVGNGNGFATGMEFGVNFGGEFPSNTNWRGYVAVNVGGGFDLMLINVQNAHCSGSSEPVGVNGYYAMGQVYAYLDGGLGVRKYKDNGDLKNEYNLGSLQVAALLQGKLPKPTFVYGAIGIQANVLGVINFSFTADVELGDNCTLVGI